MAIFIFIVILFYYDHGYYADYFFHNIKQTNCSHLLRAQTVLFFSLTRHHLSVFVPAPQVDCYMTSQYQSAHTCLARSLCVQEGQLLFEGVRFGWRYIRRCRR